MSVALPHMLVAVEVETTEGTDVIDGSPSAFLNVSSCEVTPVRGRIANPNVKGVHSPGAHKTFPSHCTVSITVPMDGATAGDAPSYSPLLRAAGLVETISSSTSATYTPGTVGHKTATVYKYILQDDGKYRLYISTGVRFNLSLDAQNSAAPMLTFEGMGKYVAPATTTISGPSLPDEYGEAKKFLCSDGMTFEVGGASFGIEGFDLSTNWTINEIRTLTGSSQLDAVYLTRGEDSHIGGGLNFVYSADFESVLTKHGADTEFEIEAAWSDGTDTITFTAPKVQFDQWARSGTNYSVPYMCNGDFGSSEVGNNDFTLVYT